VYLRVFKEIRRRRRKRKKNCKESNYRRRRKLTPGELAIEDFLKCEDNAAHGRKYPVRKQRIMEHLGFVLTTVRKFPDAEGLVRMGLLEGVGAVLKRLGAVRDIILSVLNVLNRKRF
jgi:hypothetical protein